MPIGLTGSNLYRDSMSWCRACSKAKLFTSWWPGSTERGWTRVFLQWLVECPGHLSPDIYIVPNSSMQDTKPLIHRSLSGIPSPSYHTSITWQNERHWNSTKRCYNLNESWKHHVTWNMPIRMTSISGLCMWEFPWRGSSRTGVASSTVECLLGVQKPHILFPARLVVPGI